MTCKETVRFIHEFLDHELPESEYAGVRDHVESCPTCWRAFEFERKLRSTVWEKGQGVQAPSCVVERIKRAVFHSDSRQSTASQRSLKRPLRPAWTWTTALVPLFSVVLIILMFKGWKGPAPLVADLVVDHIAYTTHDKPSEMISSNETEVETWLESKLGYGIAVPQFNESDMRLVGGRLIKLRGEKAAYLFYQDGKHILSLYVTRGPNGDLCSDDRFQLQDCRLCLANIQNCELCLSKHDDYNILSWQEDGITYAMVSNLGSDHMLDVTCPSNTPS